MNPRQVPVIVLNWNGWRDTFACLHSVRSSADAGVVWLVDNASEDDRAAEARSIVHGLRCLRWEANHGFTGGYNRALRMARQEGYEFAYLLNNDATVVPGFLSSVVELAVTDVNLASVGSLILYDGTNFVEHDGRWNPRGGKRWPPGGNKPEKPTGGVRLRYPEFASGGGMLVRLEAMEQCGYLDERFFFCWEDAEWGRRIERHGLSSALCPESIVFHKGGKSDRDGNAIYYRTRNRFLLLEPEDPTERRRIIRRLLYDASVLAECARRDRDWESWLALAAATDDALRGRFGRRPGGRARMRAVARLMARSLGAHLHDKRRALRNLPPGYDEPSPHCVDEDVATRGELQSGRGAPSAHGGMD